MRRTSLNKHDETSQTPGSRDMRVEPSAFNAPSISRRALLKELAAGLSAAPVASRNLGAQKEAPVHAPVAREVFVKSPGKGTAVMAFAYDTHSKGGSLLSIEQRWSRSDTIDVAYYRWSKDNGRTWTDPVQRSTGEKRPNGMLRRHPRGGYVDAGTGRFIEIWNEGILPGDDPLEGMRQWNIFGWLTTACLVTTNFSHSRTFMREKTTSHTRFSCT